MDKTQKKLRDAVGAAGARLARAQLNLALAERALQAANKAVLDYSPPSVAYYNIRLISSGNNKIQVIKAIRNITGLGLKEAKDVTDFASDGDSRAFIIKGVESGRGAEIEREIVLAGGTTRREAVAS